MLVLEAKFNNKSTYSLDKTANKKIFSDRLVSEKFIEDCSFSNEEVKRF